MTTVKVEHLIHNKCNYYIVYLPDGKSYFTFSEGTELYKLGVNGLTKVFNDIIEQRLLEIDITNTYAKFDFTFNIKIYHK